MFTEFLVHEQVPSPSFLAYACLFSSHSFASFFAGPPQEESYFLKTVAKSR